MTMVIHCMFARQPSIGFLNRPKFDYLDSNYYFKASILKDLHCVLHNQTSVESI